MDDELKNDDEFMMDELHNENTDNAAENPPKNSNKSKAAKPQKSEKLQQQLDNLTSDLQRTRADFENYRKRMDSEKTQAFENGKSSAILKLLPVIDNIERAIAYIPEELADNKWAQSVSGLVKNLEKSLDSLNLKRIEAAPGTEFDPAHHEAIGFDEEAEGEKEVIAEELQAGYTLAGRPIRHAMVRVTRK